MELIQIIPTSDDRIIVNSNYKIDSTSSNQILIHLKLMESKDTSVINVSTIFDTLNTMIINKTRTAISRNNLTMMLDETYGLKKYSKFIQRF